MVNDAQWDLGPQKERELWGDAAAAGDAAGDRARESATLAFPLCPSPVGAAHWLKLTG